MFLIEGCYIDQRVSLWWKFTNIDNAIIFINVESYAKILTAPWMV